MESEPIWLTRKMVAGFHQRQILQHGGGQGVRDEALIESALARPQNRWRYSPETDLPALAAAYGFGLTKNHGFVDGNKRVGFVALAVFLELNGLRVDAPEEEVVVLMTEVASGERSEDGLAEWIRGRIVPRR